MQAATVIDVHAHAVFAETMGAAGEYGPELSAAADGSPWFRVGDYVLQGVKYRDSPFMDVELRLHRMQQAGIDFQVLSPNPLTYFHRIDQRQAIEFCRRHNDALAATVAQHRRHLGGLAALPMQNIPAAIAELGRAVGELGLLGGYIGANLPVSLDSPELDAFYAKVVELDVPLFIHPSPPATEGLEPDPRLARFDFEIMLGFAAQETMAAATLIIGGVLDRHPQLDVCLSHGGGAIAFMAGRLASAAGKRPWAPSFLRIEGAFEARLRRLWFDTHVHDERSLKLLLEVVGGERLVYGSNFAGWDQISNCRQEALAIPADLAGNARRLLRLS